MSNGQDIVKPTVGPRLEFGTVDGIEAQDLPVVTKLRDVWAQKYQGNVKRSQYYTAHERFKDFRVSVPPQIAAQAKAMIGWPAKAVRTLADLSAFEGFDLAGHADTYGVHRICEDNDLPTAMQQAIVSAYTHSCAFLTVTNTDRGVTITPRSAEWGAAIWDALHNRIGAAMTIADTDMDGNVTQFNVWLAHCLYECRNKAGKWSAVRHANPLGRPTVVPICYDPQLDRPFGRSRISRPLMALTDIGIRTVVRMEANAEFYSAPKLWFLGLQGKFKKDVWSSLVSAINGVSKDLDGDVPQLQQVSQASMAPHTEMLRTIAMLVASETSLPVNDLGITMDNPASAEAMAAAERKLSREADRQNRLFGRALKDVMGMAVMLDQGLSEVPDEIRDLRPVWAPTREVSDGARADYYAKVAGVNPAWGDSDVGLAKLGLTFSELQSFRAYQREQRAKEHIDQLRANNAAQAAADDEQKQVTETIDVNETPTSGGGE